MKTFPLIALVASLMLLAARESFAGVTAENVIVVVNADSQISRTVANHYIHARDIPSVNVIFLEGVPTNKLKIGLEDFKSKILLPVLNQLNARRLAGQARVIAYSADFPTSIDVSADKEKLTDPNQIKYQNPTASINGLTYLYRFLLADDPGYLGWTPNLYARGSFQRNFINPFAGERAETFKQAEKDLAEDRAEQAAEGFKKLFDDFPSLSPLAIRAAEAYVKADDQTAAKEMLKKAIAGGWWSATYLRDSEELSPLLVDREIAAIVRKLPDAPTIAQLPVGFAGNRGWTPCGHSIPNIGDAVPYLMSCMLAVVHPRGSTVDQAVAVFDRAVEGDHSFPEASFWFTSTGDIRTKTRFPGIGNALLWLKHYQRDCEIIRAVMPNKPGNCVGLMLGSAKMSLPGKDWSFVAGAISDNLTSLSGHFGSSSQTKITELLHAGVAMTSGPVAEPYSVPFKFPTPMMYGYYASGVTAIEAFYLSVASPYQLLIVGDPVCQPYARPPLDWLSFEVESKSSDSVSPAGTAATKKIRVSRKEMKGNLPHTIARKIEFFVEGKLVRETPPAANIDIRLPAELSGEIEVRGVLVGYDPTEPRAAFSEILDLAGPISAPKLEVTETEPGNVDVVIDLRISADGADSIEVVHHSEVIGKIEGETGTLQVNSEKLGGGPVRLRAVAHHGQTKIPGRPIVVDLE